MLSPISNDGERDFPTVLLSGSSIVGLDFNILEDIFEEIETMINDCGDDGDCYKGCTKKSVPFSKFESGLLTRTVCPRRLSFSQFGVLMSTLNCEKENLLGQTVLVKRPLLNFEKGTFFVHPLFYGTAASP